MTTITIALCQEDRDRLDKIIEALEQTQLMPAEAHIVAQDKQQTKTEVAAEVTTEIQKVAKEAANAANEEKTIEESTKVVSLSDIQKKVVELSAAGKKSEVRDIITKFANRVSAIPAEHTAEVWDLLIGLES